MRSDAADDNDEQHIGREIDYVEGRVRRDAGGLKEDERPGQARPEAGDDIDPELRAAFVDANRDPAAASLSRIAASARPWRDRSTR